MSKEDAELQRFIADRIGDPQFRAWLKSIGADIERQKQAAKPAEPSGEEKGLLLNFVPSEKFLAWAKAKAEEISRVSGKPYEIRLGPGVQEAMNDAKLDNKLSKLFGGDE